MLQHTVPKAHILLKNWTFNISNIFWHENSNKPIFIDFQTLCNINGLFLLSLNEVPFLSIFCRGVDPVFKAIWADHRSFDEVLISKRMVQDHMPDNVLRALEKVR